SRTMRPICGSADRVYPNRYPGARAVLRARLRAGNSRPLDRRRLQTRSDRRNRQSEYADRLRHGGSESGHGPIPLSRHRGSFIRGRFNLADYVEVKSANIADGLLQIELQLELPEAMKPRRIDIKSGNDIGKDDNVRTEHS